MLDQPLRAWPLLGAVPLTDWSPAREEVHVACQLLASFGRTHVPPRTDHGHEALWVRPGARS